MMDERSMPQVAEPPPRHGWLILCELGCALIVAGALFGCCGRIVFDGGYQPFWPSPIAPPGQAAQRAFVEQWAPMFLGLDLMGIIVVAAVAIAGVGVLARQRWSIAMLTWAAVAKIVHAVAAVLLIASTTAAQVAAIAPGGGTSTSRDDVIMLATIGMIIAFLWRTSVPIALLVILRRSRARREAGDWAAEQPGAA